MDVFDSLTEPVLRCLTWLSTRQRFATSRGRESDLHAEINQRLSATKGRPPANGPAIPCWRWPLQ